MTGFPDFTRGQATTSALVGSVIWSPGQAANTGVIDVSPYRSIILTLSASVVAATAFAIVFYSAAVGGNEVASIPFVRFAYSGSKVSMVTPVAARYVQVFANTFTAASSGEVVVYGTTTQMQAGIIAPTSISDLAENHNLAPNATVMVAPIYAMSGKAYVNLTPFGSTEQAVLFAYDGGNNFVPVWQAATTSTLGETFPLYLPISDWAMRLGNVGSSTEGMSLRITAEPYGG